MERPNQGIGTESIVSLRRAGRIRRSWLRVRFAPSTRRNCRFPKYSTSFTTSSDPLVLLSVWIDGPESIIFLRQDIAFTIRGRPTMRNDGLDEDKGWDCHQGTQRAWKIRETIGSMTSQTNSFVLVSDTRLGPDDIGERKRRRRTTSRYGGCRC